MLPVKCHALEIIALLSWSIINRIKLCVFLWYIFYILIMPKKYYFVIPPFNPVKYPQTD